MNALFKELRETIFGHPPFPFLGEYIARWSGTVCFGYQKSFLNQSVHYCLGGGFWSVQTLGNLPFKSFAASVQEKQYLGFQCAEWLALFALLFGCVYFRAGPVQKTLKIVSLRFYVFYLRLKLFYRVFESRYLSIRLNRRLATLKRICQSRQCNQFPLHRGVVDGANLIGQVVDPVLELLARHSACESEPDRK